MPDNAIKDECSICNIVLIGAGLAVAAVLAFMAIDLATDGKLSGALGRAPSLASVSALKADDDAAG